MSLAPVVWSKSQAATLKECGRKHALSRWQPEPPFDTDPQWESVRRLQKLSNRYLWAGSMVHETVGDLLKILRQDQPLPPLKLYLEQIQTRMREEFRASKSNSESRLRLFEHEYEVTLTKEQWASSWATVELCLSRFYSSPWMRRFETLQPECWKAVDEVLSFQVDDVKSYVKIDCAIESEGKITLIDWKTSLIKPTDGEGLAVAALYAHEVWGAEPSDVTGWVVSLADGRTLKKNFDEDILMETHLKIQDESAGLARSSDQKNPFLVPIPKNKSICERCNFKKACYPKESALAVAR